MRVASTPILKVLPLLNRLPDTDAAQCQLAHAHGTGNAGAKVVHQNRACTPFRYTFAKECHHAASQ
jgi:hypothetical protein